MIYYFAYNLNEKFRIVGGVCRPNGRVSATIIRELLRKAAVMAADDSSGEEITINDAHLFDALSVLALAGGELKRSLLGASALSSNSL